MTPREIILANIAHESSPRCGLTFDRGRLNDTLEAVERVNAGAPITQFEITTTARAPSGAAGVAKAPVDPAIFYAIAVTMSVGSLSAGFAVGKVGAAAVGAAGLGVASAQERATSVATASTRSTAAASTTYPRPTPAARSHLRTATRDSATGTSRRAAADVGSTSAAKLVSRSSTSASSRA